MRVRLTDAQATEALGEALARPLADASRHAATVVHLEGPLGAGKTTLVRGLLRALGHTGRVRSPTFTLLEPYELSPCNVSHLDLFRLSDPAELDYLGLGDLLTPRSLLLVEWAERGGERLPGPDLKLSLDYAGDGREATLQAHSPAGCDVLSRLAQVSSLNGG
jgi:tRNA threonylcarbamoyladenosine biosynthesis protein TsaE